MDTQDEDNSVIKAKNNTNRSRLHTLTRCGLLTTIGLTLFFIEARLPAPLPFPGAKLGLSNIVTLIGVYRFGFGWGAGILLSRILLGAIFGGQLLTLLYSAGGGAMTLLFLAFASRVTTEQQLWLVSPLCGIFHNLGQLWVASGVIGTTTVVYFLPYLVLLGGVSGLVIGIATQETLKRVGTL